MPLDDTGTPDYSDLYVKYGDQYGVSPYLLRAVAQHESGENAHSTSAPNRNGTYDRGLMQINDGTARGIGVRNPYDPDQSVAGAARLLRQHLDTFKGDQDMALAAYNAGPDPERWTDTQRQYVQDVKSRMPAPQPEPAAQPSVTLEGIRQKYPQYKDMSDQELLQGLHQKYYSDMPFDQFSEKLGYKPGPEAAQPADVPPLSAGKQNPLAGQKAPGGHGIVPNLPLAKVDEGTVAPQQSAAEAAEHPLPNTAPAETPATAPGLGEQVAGAAGNVLGAVKQGWQADPHPGITDYGLKLAAKYGLLDVAGAASQILRGLNAAFAGAQQSAYEIGKAIGGEQLGRDLAAAPEAFPQESMGLHGVVERPPVGGVAEPPKAAEYPGPATPELPPAPPPSPATPAAPRPSVTPEQTALAELDSVASGKPTSGALPTLEAMAKEAAPPPVETAPVAEAPVAPAPSTEPAPVAPPAEPPPHAPPAEEEPSPSPQPAASVAQPPLEKPPPRPLDAVSALIAHGGVRDMDGDLKAMGADAYSQGSRRRLVNNTRGMPLDTAREFLRDNGYLPQDADIDSVKDLIADHLSGRPTFTMEDEAEANAWRQGQQAFGERERHADALQQIGTIAESAGVRLTPEAADHAAFLVSQGFHPEEALMHADASIYDINRLAFGRRLSPVPPGERIYAPPEALQAMANATQAIVGRNARVELLDAGPGGLKIRTRNGETFTADGMTTGRLIQVALSPDKTAHFLNHEAIHALRNMGVFTPAEWKILENVAQRQDWIGRHNITERYGDLGLTHGQMVEEAIADQFGHWMTGEKPDTTFLTRLRDKLSQWFERIRNGLAGHGFQSAEDVFGSVQRGEVGAREPGFGARQRGPQDLSAAGQMAEGYMAGRRAPLPPARGAPLLGEEAPVERPRAAPEPTIKTDERQIGLPGMEPTARQAQAARDQAGPRGNQQPANEGLFAPKAPEESGTLFGRRTKGPQLQVSAPQFEVLQDKKGIEKAVRGVRAMFAPTGIPGAKPMEYALRQYNAERTRQLDQSIHALEQVRRATDKLPVDQQIDFTDRMEKGEAQPTPELQRVADALRQQFDGWEKKIQSLGKGYLIEAVENYMPHVWGNYAEWAARQPLDKTQPEMEQAARAQGASRRPLRGSGSFLKQRSFPTQREGIEAGLVPVTTNPIDLSVIKLQEMQKFYHGTRLADDMKQTGLAKWVPFDQEHEAGLEGYVPLNDSIFRPRIVGEGGRRAIGGNQPPETFGRVEPGNWYAIEPVARVFNNYMSKGLHGQDAIYDAFRASNNALNTLQLGLSGFHATFVSMDTAISKAALGIQQITQGRPIEGAKNILFAGALIPPVIHTALRGGELRRAWLDPESASPEMRKIANALVAGGGRVTMPEFFRTNASGTFFKTLGDLKHPQSAFYDAMQMFRDTKAPDGWVAQQAQRLGLSPELMRHAVQATITPIRVAGRLIDTLNQPLMGSLVPRAKLGVFADMAQNWLEAHPNASHEELTAAMTKFQDSVDNRLGQLNYDNLFWNKTQKDIAFVTTRSVGWNLGTVREIGGAFVDTGSALKAMAKMKMPEVTTRMAYTMALPVLTMQVGAILTYLATGKGPQSRLDYFYPPTGTQNENGEPERRNIPGYMKDVIDFYLHPQQTAENKTSPMLETLAELRHNKDYYGGIIYDPERSRGPMQAYGDYLLNQALPFSLRAYNKLHGDGAPALDQALGFWGFQPAPKGITNPERGEAFQRRQNMKDWRKLQREPGRIHLFDRPSP